MTKREAAQKIAKLQRLARGSQNQHEAASALAQAERLAAEHGLGTADIEQGRLSAAFDELVDQLGRAVADQETHSISLFDVGPIVSDVIKNIKDVREEDKAARLRQVAKAVSIASLLAGDHPLVSRVRGALDVALRNHDLTL
jgi:hypothetical protein